MRVVRESVLMRTFIQRPGRCEGVRFMKTQRRRVYLGEGMVSAKALRLDWSVLGLSWEKQWGKLDVGAEVGEGGGAETKVEISI